MPEPNESASRGEGPQESPQDETAVPAGMIQPREWLLKWLRKYLRALLPPRPRPKVEPLTLPSRPRPVSLRAARVVNLLDWPLFLAGPVLLAWLLLELPLRWLLPPDATADLRARAAPVLMVLGPATVGYWTNWLAIKMLFRPRRPNAVWHGLIPARREELADRIAQGILQRLLSPDIVHDYLQRSGVLRDLATRIVSATRRTADDAELRAELRQMIAERVQVFVDSPDVRRRAREVVATAIEEWTGHGFSGKLFEWTRRAWGPRLQGLALSVLPEIPRALDTVFTRIDANLDRVPGIVEQQHPRIEAAVRRGVEEALAHLDIKAIVRQQLDRMDEAELERLLTAGVDEEIVFIQTSGGVFGALVGLAILVPTLRWVLLALAGVLWVVYRRTVK